MILRFIGFALVWHSSLFIAHWFLYLTLKDIFRIDSASTLLILQLIFLGLFLSIDIAWLLTIRWHTKIGRWFYHSISIWFGTLYFLFVSCIGYWIVKGIGLSLSFNLPYTFIGSILFLLALCVSAYGIWNSYQIKVREYKLNLPKFSEKWTGKKIVMFADSHLGNVLGVNFAEEIIDVVNEQNPDIVLIPGDYFDGPAADFFELARPLSSIRSKHGVYFSSGNHEDLVKTHPYFEALEKAGVKVLNNKHVEIDELQIIGVDFRNTRGEKNFKSALEKIPFDKNKASILLRHVPASLSVPHEAGIDLVLCGHTHKAQVLPFGFLTKILFKGYDYGLKSFGETMVLTTSGVGTWGPPHRVGTNNEIVVIHIH